MSRTLRIAAFAVLSGAVGVYLGAPFFSVRGDVKRRHLPGRTSDGHYQLELSCESCHTPFGGVDQKKCTGCHASELAAGNDSHPESKFTDPRNADRVAQLDATRCTTCHGEHEAARTTRGGVTQPRDFCGVCHGKIAEERPSHEGFTPDGCTSAGWLEVEAPVGSRVVVEAGGVRQTAWVTGDSGYVGHGPARVHLGLGEAQRADRVEVHLLDGRVYTGTLVDARRRIVVTGD